MCIRDRHLDHLGPDGLGVDAIWLSPIYPSPGLDGGYDVADHDRVDPVFGSEAMFDRLVAEAHGTGHPDRPRSRHEPHGRRARMVRVVAREPRWTPRGLVPLARPGRHRRWRTAPAAEQLG